MANKAPSPLAVLVKAMHLRLRKGKEDEAAALANLAAPYLNATTTRSEALNLRALTDEQIYDLFAQLRAASSGRIHFSGWRSTEP